MYRLRSLFFTISFCFFAIVVALPVQAQTSSQQWPQRPVRFIIPLGPGSGVDITARLVADKLSAKWGQPVVVENRPGGDAFLAITAVLSAHDDHVLLFAPASTFTAHTLLHDHRFHAAVILRAMGTVALASLIKNNQARPVRRFVHWYDKPGASQELARARSRTRRELAGAGQALERDNRS